MKEKKIIGQEEWNALAQKVFGNNSDSEEKSFINKLEDYDDADLADIEDTAEQVNLYYKLKRFNSQKAFEQVKPRMDTTDKKKRALHPISNFVKIAAAVVFALLIVSVWYFSNDLNMNNEKVPVVSFQDYGISSVKLPDGTLVTLNKNSKIDYPEMFDADKREVFIEGEAFFEVTPNPDKPFIIHAGGANIKVLGTSFNVNAYPENKQIEVVVSTGKVQFYSDAEKNISGSELILDPGDKGVFVNSSKELVKMQVEDPNFLAWKTRHLIFSETSLKEVITHLTKIYDVDISTVGSDLDTLKYTGHFENQPVDFILEVISLTLEFKVEEDNDSFILKKES